MITSRGVNDMRRLRGLWRWLRNPIDRTEWAWLRYRWTGDNHGETSPLPVIVAHLRVAVLSYWETRNRVAELEKRVADLETRLYDDSDDYPEEEGR